jgi:hypothetical protein
MAETAAAVEAEVAAAAGPEAVLVATGEAAASGVGHGTAEQEDMAAVGGGLAGCRDSTHLDNNFVFYICFTFHSFFFLLKRL